MIPIILVLIIISKFIFFIKIEASNKQESNVKFTEGIRECEITYLILQRLN